MSALEAAIALAAEAHSGQVDKAGEPYILHVIRVVAGCTTPEARIAAALHDTVEDCGLELRLIRHRFGDAVADAVDAVTHRDDETYAQFITRCGKNAIAKEVKLADLADNMNDRRLPQPLSHADHRRLMKYHEARNTLLGRPL